jgi:hypothetical protein
MSVQLFKYGDSMAIKTDCGNEGQFRDEFCELLNHLIDQGTYEGDWMFQFQLWLDQYVEIVNAYRGYKCKVEKSTVITCGNILMGAEPSHQYDPRKSDDKVFE